MPSLKQCDEFLLKHHQYISSTVLAFAVIVALDLVTPTLLLAQELSPSPTYTPPPSYQVPSTQYQGTTGQYPQMPPQGPTGTPPSQSPFPGGMMQYPSQSGGQYQTQPNQPMPAQYGDGQKMPQQNFGGGQPGQMGGNFGGQNGPSEEQMNKQQAQREVQQLKQMKSGMRGMEQGIKMFQRQIASLTKKGIPIPSEISENITKITSILQALKTTEKFEDAQDLMQELPDMMELLNEQRMTLEKLSRWPQTLKQADRMIKQLNSSLVKNKNLAISLSKKGYDISEIMNKFESGVQVMKSSRDKAVELIKTDPDAAFDEIQDNLFEQMDDLMQSDRTIKELGNLSRFSSSFKSGLAQGQATIKKLKRMKIETAELEDKLEEIKGKAAEINSILSKKPIDTDSLVGIFEDLDSMRRDFENGASELLGDDDIPWESGPQQFKQIDTGSIDKFIPQSGSANQGMNSPQMSPGTF